ncbi:hypothetical protein L288_19060 [Sphingobium quisquiliarum P25]|uniref:HTH hxlR-type domain-containing protein n=1 Tax=Sphingobium quisquiliarum P25 TaxID=1329909 RepID=T0GGJ7_9SPHN|nr:hypothetical protein L288_19060 [Sphingobium quisquiliarum P25]
MAGEALLEELRATLVHGNPERTATLDTTLRFVAEHGLGPQSLPVEIIQLVGDRWSALMLTVLAAGTFRPSELQKVVSLLSHIGNSNSISQRVLTAKLRSYERLGFVRRTAWDTVPPRTDYDLTPLGHELVKIIRDIVLWCLDKEDDVRSAIQAFDESEDE